MRYISFCAGVEAASQAWAHLGWEPVAFSEIEPFPCAVLASRFPKVPNLGDCRNIHYDRDSKELYAVDANGFVRDRFHAGDIDLCIGGFPCQSFSVAGGRAGFNGESGLILEYFRLIDEIRPSWIVYENVPGMLSSSKGADFKCLVGKFVEHGYCISWRTLDTQYTRMELFPNAIPQRRRRVFVVGYRMQSIGHFATATERVARVLLEPESVRGNTPPRRIKGQGFTNNLANGVKGADSAMLQIRGGKEGVGKGSLVKHELAPCIGCAQDSTLFTTMSIQGSMIGRKDENGPQGDGVGDEVMFTQNCIDRHAVAIKVDVTNSNGEDVSPTVSATIGKGTQNQLDNGGGYLIERRVEDGGGGDDVETFSSVGFSKYGRTETSGTLDNGHEREREFVVCKQYH